MIEYNGQNVESGYIVYGGICIDSKDGEISDEIFPHNEQTWALYNKGLSSLESETIGFADYLEGIQVEKDKLLAQWFVNGNTRLVEIKQ